MRGLKRFAGVIFCALPMILFCLMSGSVMLPFAAAVFVHESAHLVVLRLAGGRLRSFAPAPFGLCMEIDENTLTLRGEAAVAAAGSAANLLCTLISLLLYRLCSVDILSFGIISMMLALLNLLPAAPLDGGRLLYVCLAARRGPDFAARCLCALTYIISFFWFLFASYLLLTTQQGLYAVLFSMYIFVKNAGLGSK